MKWIQVSVDVDAEAAEAVADVLSRFVPGGVAIEVRAPGAELVPGDVTVRAYLPDGPDAPQIQDRLAQALWHMGQIYPIPAPTFSIVAETDWTDAWKKHFHPLRIGQHIVIKPTWRDFELAAGDVLIELDPGMAFGTGLHPTTQLCLTALEEQVWPGMRVLDLGTGSGILAVAAIKLGAGAVLAIDTDPVAVDAARQNCEHNGVAGAVTVVQGSLDQATDDYDLVVVNILANVIIALAQEGLAERVRPGGCWMAAGIIETQAAEVVQALETTGLQVNQRRQLADWVALIGDRMQPA